MSSGVAALSSRATTNCSDALLSHCFGNGARKVGGGTLASADDGDAAPVDGAAAPAAVFAVTFAGRLCVVMGSVAPSLAHGALEYAMRPSAPLDLKIDCADADVPKQTSKATIQERTLGNCGSGLRPTSLQQG